LTTFFHVPTPFLVLIEAIVISATVAPCAAATRSGALAPCHSVTLNAVKGSGLSATDVNPSLRSESSIRLRRAPQGMNMWSPIRHSGLDPESRPVAFLDSRIRGNDEQAIS